MKKLILLLALSSLLICCKSKFVDVNPNLDKVKVERGDRIKDIEITSDAIKRKLEEIRDNLPELPPLPISPTQRDTNFATCNDLMNVFLNLNNSREQDSINIEKLRIEINNKIVSNDSLLNAFKLTDKKTLDSLVKISIKVRNRKDDIQKAHAKLDSIKKHHFVTTDLEMASKLDYKKTECQTIVTQSLKPLVKRIHIDNLKIKLYNYNFDIPIFDEWKGNINFESDEFDITKSNIYDSNNASKVNKYFSKIRNNISNVLSDTVGIKNLSYYVITIGWGYADPNQPSKFLDFYEVNGFPNAKSDKAIANKALSFNRVKEINKFFKEAITDELLGFYKTINIKNPCIEGKGEEMPPIDGIETMPKDLQYKLRRGVYYYTFVFALEK